MVMLKCCMGLMMFCGFIEVGLEVFMFGSMVVMFSVGLNSVNKGKVGRLILLGWMLNIFWIVLICVMKVWC